MLEFSEFAKLDCSKINASKNAWLIRRL